MGLGLLIFSLTAWIDIASFIASIIPQLGPVANISYVLIQRDSLFFCQIWPIWEMSYIANYSYLTSSFDLTMNWRSFHVVKCLNGEFCRIRSVISFDVSKKTFVALLLV